MPSSNQSSRDASSAAIVRASHVRVDGPTYSLTKVRDVSDGAMIETVRGFNRIVTQRVGALQDGYLARDRPLAESRLLWEIGERGCDVRTLRSRLDLDSGYLSRLLRSLEASGLATVGASQRDRRIRTARLTDAGRRERALLDDRSDELARSMLAPLSDGQRDHLVAAMAQIQKLLTASMVAFEVDGPGPCPCAVLHARVLLRAGPPVRERIRPRGQHAGRCRRPATARRHVPGRHAPRRTGRLWRAQVPRRRSRPS